MKIIKLVFVGCILVFAFKHSAQIHLPVLFASRTPEQLKERVQELEREIGFKRQIIANIKTMAKGPAVGTVIGTTACGAKIVVSESAQPQAESEVGRLQGEINDLERKLHEIRQIPANSSESRR